MGKRSRWLKRRIKEAMLPNEGYQAYSTPAPMAPCHKGNIKVFSDPGSNLVFYGGGSNRDANPYELGDDVLVLDLGDRFPPLVTAFGVHIKHFLQVYKYSHLLVAWNDGEGSPIIRVEWDALLKDMRAYGAYKGKNEKIPVLVCCIGGHGRTGSCLAVLAFLTGAYKDDPKKDVVAWVRKKYCDKAVETARQIQSLEKLTGLKITSKESVTTYQYNTDNTFTGLSDAELKKYGLIKANGKLIYVGTSSLNSGSPNMGQHDVPYKPVTFDCIMCGQGLTCGYCKGCYELEAECSCVPKAGYGKEAYKEASECGEFTE